MPASSPFSKIDHIAIIVNSMDEATKFYESLGMGPFQPVVVSLSKREVRGKAVTDVKNKASLGRIGDAMIELVEPLEGKANIYKEFRDKKGEGIQHVCFTVDDIEKATASVVAKGVKVLSIGRFSDGGGYTYFDTASIGGVILELMQWSPGFTKPAAKPKSLFSKPDHVGVIVKDGEKVRSYYQSLGVLPFEPLKGVLSVERKAEDKPIDPASFRLDARMARAGALKFEVIEPLFGQSLWKEYVERNGDGINHLGFYIDNYSEEVEKFRKKGFKALYEAKFQGGGGAVYFDTRKVGGIILELLKWPPGSSVA